MYSSILRTLAYADIFDSPLTAPEIHRFLIGKKTSLDNVKTTLKKHRLPHQKNYYYLSGRSHLVSLRRRRQQISRDKHTFATRVEKWLKIIPTIKAVIVTGALAVNNAPPDDDIDLFIITSSGNLWTTRLLVNLILDSFRLRRKPDSDKLHNKFCLNLWLDQSHLLLPKSQQNLYTAHEIAQTKLIWSRGNAYHQFLWQNRWLLDFLPHTPIPKGSPSKAPKPLGINYLEKAAFKLQAQYMKSKITREKITPHSAFFHPLNMPKYVSDKYHLRLQKLGIKP